MDYKKFHRTNVIIELAGSTIAAVWAVINLFLAEVSAPLYPIMSIVFAGLIKNSRCIMLTGREEYQPESYAESQKNSYTDNRRLYIVSAVCSCAALVLVIVKMIIR